MLVLTRKKNEQIVVSPPGKIGDLVITVVEIRGDKVRLGLEHPREWESHRKEVYDQIHGRDPNTP